MLARDVRPWDDPALVLRAAAAAAQAGLRLAPHALERLVAECPALPEPWPRPALDALVSLLGAGRPAVVVWEALDQAGLTSRLLPDWERVRSRPQRNAVHRFTVDRHLLEARFVRPNASRWARRPARPAAARRAVPRHRQGLARRPLRGRGRRRRRPGAAARFRPRGRRRPRDAGPAPPAAARHGHPARPRGPGDGGPRRRVAYAAPTCSTCCTRSPRPTGSPPGRRLERVEGRPHRDLVTRTHAVLGGHEVPAPAMLADAYADLVDAGELAGPRDPPVAGGLEVTVVAPDRLGLLAAVARCCSLNRLTVRSASTQTSGSVAVQVWQVLPEYGEPPALVRLREDVRRALDGTLDVGERLAVREASAADAAGSGRTAPARRGRVRRRRDGHRASRSARTTGPGCCTGSARRSRPRASTCGRPS